MTHVYWIHLKEHTLEEGYIGVSNNATQRYSDHCYLIENEKHENIHLTRAFKKYKKEIIFTILAEGPELYCYEIEIKLRPIKNIGWNIAEGDHKPPLSHNSPWLGKKQSAEMIAKRVFSHKKTMNEKYGVDNPSQLSWVSEKKKLVKRPDVVERNKILKAGSRPFGAKIEKAVAA